MRNFLENLAMVHFVHRSLALLLVAIVLVFWWRARSAPWGGPLRTARNGMLAALALQVVLGIATVLSAVAPPLAAAHQAGAVLLFACVLRSAFLSRPAR
jgi:cytochrome c oxidase assembly protein subunit 15